MTIGTDESVLNDIAAMMGEFVDNWPNPKKVSTALALIAKTMRAALNPPRHDYWGAGEPDCPREIKAGNGELHTMRCKVCGLDNPRDDYCRTRTASSRGRLRMENTCAFVDRFGKEVSTSPAAYQEIRRLRDRLEEIEYHAAQLGTYIAQWSATEKQLASARHHAGKIAALAKVNDQTGGQLSLEECPDCENGRRWVSKHGGNDPDVWTVRCERCDGTGKIEGDS